MHITRDDIECQVRAIVEGMLMEQAIATEKAVEKERKQEYVLCSVCGENKNNPNRKYECDC